MSPRHPSVPGGPVDLGAKTGFADELRSLEKLAPYLWPRDSSELRLRVVLALICLAVSKIVNITVPLLYKQSVDALTPGHSLAEALGS